MDWRLGEPFGRRSPLIRRIDESGPSTGNALYALRNRCRRGLLSSSRVFQRGYSAATCGHDDVERRWNPGVSTSKASSTPTPVRERVQEDLRVWNLGYGRLIESIVVRLTRGSVRKNTQDGDGPSAAGEGVARLSSDRRSNSAERYKARQRCRR